MSMYRVKFEYILNSYNDQKQWAGKAHGSTTRYAGCDPCGSLSKMRLFREATNDAMFARVYGERAAMAIVSALEKAGPKYCRNITLEKAW